MLWPSCHLAFLLSVWLEVAVLRPVRLQVGLGDPGLVEIRGRTLKLGQLGDKVEKVETGSEASWVLSEIVLF